MSVIMRVSKEKLAENRAALIDAASRLFREKGIDGVGVAEIARAAGLTHGALYAHFPSKDALVAAALEAGFGRSVAFMRRTVADRDPSFAGYVDFLLSSKMRDAVGNGCPMTASCSEVGRQGEEVSARFTEGLEGMAAAVEEAIGEGASTDERRKLGLATIAAYVGAIAIARGVETADPNLSEEVIEATRHLLKRVGSN
jgi:TetR/AcrR family transcriptional regulator, transcriptional repressor for nem operon